VQSTAILEGNQAGMDWLAATLDFTAKLVARFKDASEQCR